MIPDGFACAVAWRRRAVKPLLGGGRRHWSASYSKNDGFTDPKNPIRDILR